ncbi:MAG: helix-turn-helix transcriptional regulator [Clostridia bacterium]|nr:helix-turn-helix transcriptional regulator [Clostridia bacterium]
MENRMQINTDISLTIDLLGYLLCEGHWSGSSHFHPFWEMVITTSDFKRFQTDVFFPNESHKFENDSEREKHLLYIGFDFEKDVSYSRQQIKEALQITLNDSANSYLYAALFKQLRGSGTLPTDTHFYMQLMLFLMNQLGKYMSLPAEASPNTALVADVKKFINANLHKKINVQQLAKAFYVTPKHLGQVFRREVGEGIVQYTKRKKVEKALLLIKTKEYNITQISQMLGFDNIHYFSTVFKEYYGLSPTYFYTNNK